MPYESLRDFIARLEQAGRLKRVSVPVDPHLEMTEIQTRLLAEQGPAILFEKPVGRDGRRYEHADAGQSVRHGGARRLGHGPRAQRAARGRRDAGLPEAAGAAGRLARSGGDVPAAEDRAGDEAEDGRLRALPGRGADRRPDRPRPAADPGLLAGRAGAADHLAAGRDQGPTGKQTQGRRFQPRHLSHAGDWARTRP